MPPLYVTNQKAPLVLTAKLPRLIVACQAPQQSAAQRDAGAAVGGIPRGAGRRLRLQPLLRSLWRMAQDHLGDDAPNASGRGEAVRRLRRRHGTGVRSNNGASRPHLRRRARGVQLRLCGSATSAHAISSCCSWTSPKSAAISPPVQRANPAGGGHSNTARMRRPVAAPYFGTAQVAAYRSNRPSLPDRTAHATPQADRPRHRVYRPCDRSRRTALGSQQHDPCAQRVALFRRRRPHPGLKHRTIRRRQPDFRSFGNHPNVRS